MLADRYNADDLKKNATKFINKNIKAVCKKVGWIILEKSHQLLVIHLYGHNS